MKLAKSLIISASVAIAASGMVSCGGKQGAASDGAATEAVDEVSSAKNTESVEAVVVLGEGEEIAPAAGKLVVIDFNATWCGPCKQFAPHFDAVAGQNAGKATFYSVDVDVHPELAAKYGVESIPMVVYIRPDGTTDSSVGYMDEAAFAAAVAEHLK